MSTVDHNSWNSYVVMVLVFAKQAGVLIEHPTHKYGDLVVVEIRCVVGLLEKICCWVLESFHLNLELLRYFKLLRIFSYFSFKDYKHILYGRKYKNS